MEGIRSELVKLLDSLHRTVELEPVSYVLVDW